MAKKPSALKGIIILLAICALIGGWFAYSEIHSATAQEAAEVQFTIEEGESVAALANRLESEQIIRSATFFKKYLTWKGLDTEVRAGQFTVTSPITLARVVAALAEPSVDERTITLIPGWGLREMAAYFEEEGIATADEFYAVAGRPAVRPTSIDIFFEEDPVVLSDKPGDVSLEGYLRPDTYRIFKDATIKEIVTKLIVERQNQFTGKMIEDIRASGRSIHEVMTIASLVEREVRTDEDRPKVADIFWRRYDANWALQADSTVHYAVGKTGDVFTSATDRESLSPWNTYKYTGLPPGPISAPSLDSIMAAIYSESNDDWYFLTDFDGNVHYASSLDGHNANVYKYLR